MKELLEKLEQKMKNWLDTLDYQLHQPIVSVIKGEVFTQNSGRK